MNHGRLAFDLTWTTSNVKKPSEYTSTKFKSEESSVFEFFDRFDHKFWFKYVVKQLLRNEVFVCAVRNEGKRMILQELPLKYIKITARWEYGFLVSFDFSYFLQQGINIDFYPSWFKKKFLELFHPGSDAKDAGYHPPVNPQLRGAIPSGQFAYWVDVPPDAGVWAFKFDPTIVTAIPYFAGMLPDLINQSVMRNLQKDADMAAASRMVLGQVPMLKEAKSNVKDMIAIDADTLGKFLALVKSALSNAIKVAAAPLEELQSVEFDKVEKLYDDYLRTTLASSGMNTALFYTSDLKANTVESQLSHQSDSLIMETLYSPFNWFLEYYINQETSKYHFIPELVGNEYYLNRQARLTQAKDMAQLGMVLPQLFSSAIGMKPSTFQRMLDEAKAKGFVDNLTPIIMGGGAGLGDGGNPSSPSSKSPGRPKVDDSEISDSGEQTRQDGGNEETKV